MSDSMKDPIDQMNELKAQSQNLEEWKQKFICFLL